MGISMSRRETVDRENEELQRLLKALEEEIANEKKSYENWKGVAKLFHDELWKTMERYAREDMGTDAEKKTVEKEKKTVC